MGTREQMGRQATRHPAHGVCIPQAERKPAGTCSGTNPVLTDQRPRQPPRLPAGVRRCRGLPWPSWCLREAAGRRDVHTSKEGTSQPHQPWLLARLSPLDRGRTAAPAAPALFRRMLAGGQLAVSRASWTRTESGRRLPARPSGPAGAARTRPGLALTRHSRLHSRSHNPYRVASTSKVTAASAQRAGNVPFGTWGPSRRPAARTFCCSKDVYKGTRR